MTPFERLSTVTQDVLSNYLGNRMTADEFITWLCVNASNIHLTDNDRDWIELFLTEMIVAQRLSFEELIQYKQGEKTTDKPKFDITNDITIQWHTAIDKR